MWKHFRKVQQKDEIIKFLKRFILFLGVCVSMYGYVHKSEDDQRGEKRVSES